MAPPRRRTLTRAIESDSLTVTVSAANSSVPGPSPLGDAAGCCVVSAGSAIAGSETRAPGSVDGSVATASSAGGWTVTASGPGIGDATGGAASSGGGAAVGAGELTDDAARSASTGNVAERVLTHVRAVSLASLSVEPVAAVRAATDARTSLGNRLQASAAIMPSTATLIAAMGHSAAGPRLGRSPARTLRRDGPEGRARPSRCSCMLPGRSSRENVSARFNRRHWR